ncbi:zinc metallopeptidase [Thalassolituus sp. LLYu03]|uniref:zinc metallopeptidase n=1 Tax=Thalassolituus sp. LLYu03 TaxID=3421656 RepID=UPI003D2D364F
MIWLILLVLLVAVLVGPWYWIQYVLRRHSGVRDDYPGTGGDMARHLLDKLGLDQVGVEATDAGDHYSRAARCVRLTADKLDGKSLTAVVIAAHEVGHAIQHARGEALFRARGTLDVLAMLLNRIAPIALLLAPVLVGLWPVAGRLSLLVAVGAMLVSTLVHLVTLPVEWDASFGKALPLLRDGGYLDEQDMRHARTILTAAAFTYVAASLMSMLNVGRWLRLLRR